VKRHGPSKMNPQIYSQACEWFVEFRSGEPDEASRRAFHAWLQESPAHMGAYLDVAAHWDQSASLDLTRKWPRESLIAAAFDDAAVVVAHPSASEAVAAVEEGVWRKALQPKTRFALAACIALGLALAGLFAWLNYAPTYSTGTGEQHSIVLRDGSTVNLNSRSRVRIRYSAHERAVDLLQGQALFTVAKDAARPFIVSTDSAQVRAVGTEFDVYRKTTGTVVTVLEGRVAVLTPHADAGSAGEGDTQAPKPSSQSATEARMPVRSREATRLRQDRGLRYLSAGEQLTVTAKGVPEPVPVNVVAATAWTQRQLVFDATPLREVAEEFNRYNTRQLVIRDPRLDAFQIDGVFSSTDPSSLIRFLRERPDMHVTETDSEIAIKRR